MVAVQPTGMATVPSVLTPRFTTRQVPATLPVLQAHESPRVVVMRQVTGLQMCTADSAFAGQALSCIEAQVLLCFRSQLVGADMTGCSCSTAGALRRPQPASAVQMLVRQKHVSQQRAYAGLGVGEGLAGWRVYQGASPMAP